jgi:hypothetical protein
MDWASLGLRCGWGAAIHDTFRGGDPSLESAMGLDDVRRRRLAAQEL